MNRALLDVIFFEMRGLRCALPLSVVRSVVPMCTVTSVPLLPAIVRGIASITGQILPVLDLDQCFQPVSDAYSELPVLCAMKDKLLLLESAPAMGKTIVHAALAVDRQVTIGSVDEHHSRPPPPRPSFLSATILDKSGPALLLDAERTIDYVREAISAVTKHER
jgi:chemotaxis signal transduction protein